MSFHLRLREAIVSSGKPPREICRLAGIQSASLIAYCLDRSPRVDTAARLARAIGCQPGWLAFGTDGQGGDDGQGLAGRLYCLRKERGLTLRGVGGISYAAIALIERGRGALISSIESIAKSVNVDPAWLAYGETAPKPAMTREEAVARVLAGEAARRVAAECGVSHTAVGKWLRAAGVPARSYRERRQGRRYRCRVCGDYLPRSNYYANRASPHGIGDECKRCRRAARM